MKKMLSKTKEEMDTLVVTLRKILTMYKLLTAHLTRSKIF